MTTNETPSIRKKWMWKNKINGRRRRKKDGTRRDRQGKVNSGDSKEYKEESKG